MRAVVNHEYGSPDVMRMEEVAKPVPGDGEVLIEIYAASVNAYDWHLLTADIFLVRLASGLRKPKSTILGADIAGRVAAVGANVTQFRPGDAVFGSASAHGNGGFAEYVVVPESAVAPLPANLTFEEAAAVPMAATTALQGLRDAGQIKPGQKVLIAGASGGVGTYAVQLAKLFGAEVTAVCSTRNVEQARALGADHVIDYTVEDFTRNGSQYDLILGVNGYRSLGDYKSVLAPGGRYVMAGGKMGQIFQAMLLGPLMSRDGRKMGNVSEKPNQKDLIFLKEMIEAGKLTPVIDRRYPLEETADALRYLGAGHARGKVVITVKQDDSAPAKEVA